MVRKRKASKEPEEEEDQRSQSVEPHRGSERHSDGYEPHELIDNLFCLNIDG